MKQKSGYFVKFLIGLMMVLALPARADIRTWLGATTNWNATANWTGGIVPTNGDDVVVKTNAPPNTNQPTMQSGTYPTNGGSYASFSVSNGATIICLGDTGVVNEASGGTLAVPHGTGVAINVSGYAYIDGALNANGRGFWAQKGPGGSTASFNGGTHGGIGALQTSVPYGRLRQPTALGSGGFFGNTPGVHGVGGGAIQLSVGGALRVNGSITANGNAPNSGGAGGSIWLTCTLFDGTGSVSAVGGYGEDDRSFGSGAGGRIAIEYTSRTFSGIVNVASGNTFYGTLRGQPGTLWEPGRYANAIVSNLVFQGIGFHYFFPSTTVNSTWSLVLTNRAQVYFHDFTNGTLTVTNLFLDNLSSLRFDVGTNGSYSQKGFNNLSISNFGLMVNGTSVLAISEGTILATNIEVWNASTVDVSVLTGTCPNLAQLTVMRSTLNFGNVTLLPTLTNISISGSNAMLYLSSQTYHLNELTIPTNTTIYCCGNPTVTNEASGGGTLGDGYIHGAGVTLDVDGSVIVDGTLNAERFGFPGGMKTYLPGSYLGPGTSPNVTLSAGGHGGKGGNSTNRPYGSLTMPTALGSASFYADQQGGGAIKVIAGNTLRVNGTITARGGGVNAASGSGGSLWLVASNFEGSGMITAEGPNAQRATFGGGGGGRLSLDYANSNFTGTLIVRGGGYDYPAKTGTVFVCQSPWRGTESTNGVNGRRFSTRCGIASNDVRLARVVTRFDTSFQWSDVSTDTSGSRVVTNITTYAISGLRPSYIYDVFVDGAIQFGGKLLSGTNGVLTFTNTLDGLHNFFVTPAVRGTVFTVY